METATSIDRLCLQGRLVKAGCSRSDLPPASRTSLRFVRRFNSDRDTAALFTAMPAKGWERSAVERVSGRSTFELSCQRKRAFWGGTEEMYRVLHPVLTELAVAGQVEPEVRRHPLGLMVRRAASTATPRGW